MERKREFITLKLEILIIQEGKGFKAFTNCRKHAGFGWTKTEAKEELIRTIQKEI